MCPLDPSAEWLEADGLGGFASGSASGIRTRRYHALLLVATEPPAGRGVLGNGVEAWGDTPAGSFALSSQRYLPDVVYPDGASHLTAFTDHPWPCWTFMLPDGTRIAQEAIVRPGTPAGAMAGRLPAPAPAFRLRVRPLLSGRDYHALHHENPAFRFDADTAPGRVAWHPYANLPGIEAQTSATYVHEPVWYRQFLYTEERARGLVGL